MIKMSNCTHNQSLNKWIRLPTLISCQINKSNKKKKNRQLKIKLIELMTKLIYVTIQNYLVSTQKNVKTQKKKITHKL